LYPQRWFVRPVIIDSALSWLSPPVIVGSSFVLIVLPAIASVSIGGQFSSPPTTPSFDLLGLLDCHHFAVRCFLDRSYLIVPFPCGGNTFNSDGVNEVKLLAQRVCR
jgi:hypothetical protein